MLQRSVLEDAGPAPAAGRGAVSDAEREAVLRQLDRILANPLFKHSKRYPLLFRYVVEQALSGRSTHLKERSLGVEVFGRETDYDTNLDPVVRIAAGEIRKRIAQYYHEPGHEQELRIDLPCGSYVPEFHAPPPAAEAAAAIPVVAEPARPPAEVKPRIPWAWWGGGFAAAALLLAGLAAGTSSRNAVERFWGPVWSAPGSLMLCIGGAGIAPDVAAAPAPTPELLTVTDQIRREYVSFADMTTLTRMAGLFQARGKPFAMRTGAQATFADLRNGPVVLVGGFNNGWTMRLLSQLRFGMARDPQSKLEWIEDHQKPSRREWKVDPTQPYLSLSEDYAIVSRVRDPSTERMVVVAAGLVQYGTVAAGEFLTNPEYLEELTRKAPANWKGMNVQAVIATKVIHGNSGPPRLVESYFW